MTIKEKMRCPCKSCENKPYSINGMLLELLLQLEIKVEEEGKILKINSGKRCPAYNKLVGGTLDSPHVIGEGADVKVEGMSLIDLARLCLEIGFKRIGIYPNHIHVDVVTPKPSKFWFVKEYGSSPIYSKHINDLDEFLRYVNLI
jgi:uncharacterized protein YcbK (DUF882 family)